MRLGLPGRSRGGAAAAAAVAVAVVSSAVVILLGVPPRAAAAEGEVEPLAETTVGMPAELLGVVVPGPELEAVPVEAGSREPVVLRVVATYPHGDATRYDLEVYALEPGFYDLRDSLRPAGGGELDRERVPELPVLVTSVLPAGQVLPHPLEPARSPWLGGYRLALAVAAVVWVAGLVALWRSRARPSAAAGDRGATEAAAGLAERLRPLVEKAQAGELSRDEKASLEGVLLAFWRKRLGLEEMGGAEALAVLHEHHEAGELLRVLESWLHAPPGRAGGGVSGDVARLLQPYRDAAEPGEGEGGEAGPGKVEEANRGARA